MGPRRTSSARPRCAVLCLSLIVAALAVVPVVPAPAWAAPEDDLEVAQERANRAAGELAEAEEEMARAQDAVAHLQTRVDRIDARVDVAREQVRDLAIRLYVEGTAPVIRILRMADANDVIRAQQYSRVVAGASTDSLEQFRADREDLRREQAALDEQRETHADSLDTLRERRVAAVEEIERLSEVVAEIKAAQEEERQAELAAAAALPAAASPRSEPGAPAAAAGPVGSTPGDGPASPATTSAPEEVGASEEEPEPAASTGDWICPVQGPLAFSNDYGAPRGGGYSHQGNDILAPRGTPVVASVDGEVRHRSGAVSGLAYYLDGVDGTEYFGAHLDSYGASGPVTAGTVVGYVGNTGDAASTAPHLHFEMHPGGSGNINPYPTLTKYC